MCFYSYFSTQEAFHEFVEAIHAFQVIFPDSEMQLVKLAHDLVNKLVSIFTTQYFKKFIKV